VTVRDYGLPENVERLEQQLHERPASGLNLFGCPASDVVDQVHWLAYGPEGKALQIMKWLHVTHVAESSPTPALEAFHHDVTEAPQQQYAVRRMQPDEAIEVSRLMYRTYGGTYFNQDVYYPERIAALNAQNAVVSYVAQAEDGTIAGHYALELNQEGPVAECGQAVVDPAHRGRGLMDLLREAAEKEALPLNLIGLYSDAVAVHTLTQRSNVSHGHHLTCVDLGLSPKTEQFHKIAETQPQRVTCLMYFEWLKPPVPRTRTPSKSRWPISVCWTLSRACAATGRTSSTSAPAWPGRM
jgi:GNAT superfamily N-acetyltransferase